MRPLGLKALRSHWWKAHEEREDGPTGAKRGPREAQVAIGPASQDLAVKTSKGYTRQPLFCR